MNIIFITIISIKIVLFYCIKKQTSSLKPAQYNVECLTLLMTEMKSILGN